MNAQNITHTGMSGILPPRSLPVVENARLVDPQDYEYYCGQCGLVCGGQCGGVRRTSF